MADNDGVSQLLKAEAEANKIIQQAQEERWVSHRNLQVKFSRLKELKQAKIVAEEEIKQFRNQEEQRLKEEIKKVLE